MVVETKSPNNGQRIVETSRMDEGCGTETWLGVKRPLWRVNGGVSLIESTSRSVGVFGGVAAFQMRLEC